jgi:hypothetical protein
MLLNVNAENLFMDWADKLLQKSYDFATNSIKTHLHDMYGRNSALLKDMSTCSLKNEGDCDINGMTKDESSIVVPDGDVYNTRCIFGDDYKYQVIPGKKEDLMVYFQGGGACWDKASTYAGLCTSTASPNAPVGIFDRTNNENPFKDYTIVHILYCSGDTHVGNVTRSYDHFGKEVKQVGATNSRVTLNWIHNQVKKGYLGNDNGAFDNLVVMGCSAGSVGTQLWADAIISEFDATNKAVVPDSYIGVFPEGSLGPLVRGMGFCTTELMDSAEIKESCEAGTMTIPEWTLLHISKSQDVSWSYIQSKVDIVQQSFYVAVGLTTPNTKAMITPSKYYQGVTDIMTQYNHEPNFVSYLVDGPMHCFTNMDVVYKATTFGPEGKRGKSNNAALRIAEKSNTPSLIEWLSPLPLSSQETISSECSGDMKDDSVVSEEQNGLLSAALEAPRLTYCDSDLYPKTFTDQ